MPAPPADRDEAEQLERARISLTDLDARSTDGKVVDPSLLITRTTAVAIGLLPPITTHGGPAVELAGRTGCSIADRVTASGARPPHTEGIRRTR